MFKFMYPKYRTFPKVSYRTEMPFLVVALGLFGYVAKSHYENYPEIRRRLDLEHGEHCKS